MAPATARDAQTLGEPRKQRLLDRFDRWRRAEQLLQRHHPLRRRVERALGELGFRDFQRGGHFGRVHVHQHRALIEQRVLVEEAAGAADLAPVDLDVVARPVPGGDAELAQACGRSFADLARQLGERADPERLAVEDELPAELALVEIDRAAAGDAPDHADAVGAAIVAARSRSTRPDGARSARWAGSAGSGSCRGCCPLCGRRSAPGRMRSGAGRRGCRCR